MIQVYFLFQTIDLISSLHHSKSCLAIGCRWWSLSKAKSQCIGAVIILHCPTSVPIRSRWAPLWQVGQWAQPLPLEINLLPSICYKDWLVTQCMSFIKKTWRNIIKIKFIKRAYLDSCQIEWAKRNSRNRGKWNLHLKKTIITKK